MWMGPLSGMDVALLDQWQLLSHFLQNLIFRFLQSVSLLFSLSVWQLQVLSINAGYEHDHATSGLHFLSWVLFCLVSYRASLYKTMLFMFVQKSRIQFWLFEQKDMRIEGRIIGFDEYMNLVLDDAEEISLKKKTRKPLGRILLKGDNITLMMNTGKWDCGGWAIMSDLSEIWQQFEKRVHSSDTAVKTAKWDQLACCTYSDLLQRE